MPKQLNLADIFPIPKEAARLHVLIGDWAVEGTLTYKEHSFPLKGSAIFTSAAAGWGVLAVVKLEITGLGLYEETSILGYDINQKTYHFFSLTNTSAVYDHAGEWTKDNTLNFSYETTIEQRLYREELMITFRNPHEFSILEKDTLEDHTLIMMSVALRKKRE